jgi:hypothetical protein
MCHSVCPIQGSSAEAVALAMAISQKLDVLEKELKKAVTANVVNDFKDPLRPLQNLTEAAQASLGERERDTYWSINNTVDCILTICSEFKLSSEN